MFNDNWNHNTVILHLNSAPYILRRKNYWAVKDLFIDPWSKINVNKTNKLVGGNKIRWDCKFITLPVFCIKLDIKRGSAKITYFYGTMKGVDRLSGQIMWSYINLWSDFNIYRNHYIFNIFVDSGYKNFEGPLRTIKKGLIFYFFIFFIPF